MFMLFISVPCRIRPGIMYHGILGTCGLENSKEIVVLIIDDSGLRMHLCESLSAHGCFLLFLFSSPSPIQAVS